MPNTTLMGKGGKGIEEHVEVIAPAPSQALLSASVKRQPVPRVKPKCLRHEEELQDVHVVVEEWQWPFGQWEMVNEHVLDLWLLPELLYALLPVLALP